MVKNEQLEAIRRAQLKRFIEQNFRSDAEFAAKMNLPKTNISTLLRGTRPFTDFTANKIETRFSLPHGYLSHKDNTPYVLADLIDIKFYENIKNILDPIAEKLLKTPMTICSSFKINNSENLIATRMNDDLMYPTINNDELIIIDTTQNFIEENKIYLFNVNGVFLIRRCVNAGKNMIALHIDNENEKKKYIINNIPLSDINVIGRVVGGIKSYN